MPSRFGTSEVKYYKDASEALRAVDSGEADFYYGLSSAMEHAIQKHHYTRVVPNTFINGRNDLCFALPGPTDVQLLAIMNKAINSLTTQEKETLASKNLIFIGESSLSIVEMIYANPVMSVTIIACIFLLVVILVLVVARSRVRAAKMQSSLERAESESRAKGEFLSRMSHEIRTPMNAIVGLSDLTCMMEGVPGRVRDNLDKIRSSSHYLLSLISDILDMSRIDSGMMTIAEESFSLKSVLKELDGMMTAEAGRRGLVFHMEEEISDDFLLGDAVRLKQVLTNLISNAFKFTPEGGNVQVKVSEADCSEQMVSYRFEVTDNGVGISKENQARIFGAFEQVGSNYSKSQGTGLGLAISRTIVKLMGGELKLKSEPDKGSTFYFTAAFGRGTPQPDIPETEFAGNLAGIRILLAEDNELNAEIAISLLELKGAVVLRAENGKAAVEIFRESRQGEIQAVLMDIQMPVMDGLVACRVIRGMERPDAKGIPIIAMTANSFKEDSDAAMEAGMNGFVPKPVDVEYLYRVLHKAMKKQGN